MKINKIIIIIFLSIVIGGVIGCFVFKFINKEGSINSLQTVDSLVQEYNELNKMIQMENLSNKDSFQHQMNSNLTCYKYIKSNEKDCINLIKKIYITPFDRYSNYFLENVNEEKGLYVCLPSVCDIRDISYYEEVVQEEEQKTILVGSSTYVIKKVNNEWKFPFSIIQCN